MHQNDIGGPFVKGPMGSGEGVKVLTPQMTNFLLFFEVLPWSQFYAESAHFWHGPIKPDVVEAQYPKTEPAENFI